MTPRTRLSSCLVTVVVAAVLTGCTGVSGSESAPEPTPPEAIVSPMPTAPQLLSIPDRTPGELARIVFAAEGSGRVPTSAGEIMAASVAGVAYTVEAICTPLPGTDAVAATLTVSTTDDAPAELMSGTLVCDGVPWLMSGEIPSAVAPQVAFAGMDGVAEAYARILPTDEYVSSR